MATLLEIREVIDPANRRRGRKKKIISIINIKNTETGKTSGSKPSTLLRQQLT